LDSPAIAVTLESVSPEANNARVTLRLGAETSDGRYAKLDGDSFVFVVPPQLVQALAEPLASRTLLSTPLERIIAVDLQQGEHHVHIVRHGETFDTVGSPEVDAKAASTLAEAVATLRASHVTGYGAASPAQGMRAPFAHVALTAMPAGGAGASEQRYDILLGSALADGARYARRADLDVGFVLSKDSLDKLLPTTRVK
jgi:hypothetical protein